MNSISENEIEEIALGYLQGLGYQYLNGLVLSPDGEHPERQYNEVVLVTRLRDAIEKLNPTITQDAKEDALKKVLRTDSPNALINNETFHKYLTEGVDVEVRTADGIRGKKVYIVDFNQPNNNEFLAVNQFTIIEGNQNKRPDIILLINGLPLVVIELKNAVIEKADVEAAFNQIQTYQNTIPSLFTYNAISIISDGWSAAYGTISSSLKYYKPWKSIDGKTIENSLDLQMEFLLKGLCNKEVLLDGIKNYIVFEKTETKTIKKIAQYHQYFAVKKAIETTLSAAKTEGDKKAGVVWHTQGSGKSLSMVFYTGKIVTHPAMQNPTIVVLTDRNDLDDQLFETFTNCNQLLRQIPKQAENRHHLKEILNVSSGGIVFTTIQKFQLELDEDTEPNNARKVAEPKVKYIGVKAKIISNRHNIVVIADEAHRSQYGLLDGYASRLRESLPNASYIGFTGTPIESTDKSTQAIFGNYIHVYDIQQAVRDGATVPIYYESRVAKIALDNNKKIILDETIEELTEQEELSNAQKLKAKWSSIEAVVGSKERLKKVAQDIVIHFEKKNAVVESKAMVVCMSRQICVDLYNEITALKPHWHSDDDTKGTIKVIMTGSSADVNEFQPHLRNKAQRKAIGERLKDENDDLKIVLVRDMWLTGFDAPVLNTLYVDKPMQGANLMQAIARVNRVFNNAKEGGLVVDYIGLAQYLKEAMIEYTTSGGQGAPTLDDEIAIAKCFELYEGLLHQLRHFDWQKFFMLKPEEKLKYIGVIQQYIFSQQNGNENFIDVCGKLLKAYALVSTHERIEKVKDHIALFQAIRARLLKFIESERLEKGKKSFSEIDLAIKQIVSDAIVS
ncbi:MAG: type I restriction endonuclease subunit R, partial [Cytophagales bacterium]